MKDGLERGHILLYLTDFLVELKEMAIKAQSESLRNDGQPRSYLNLKQLQWFGKCTLVHFLHESVPRRNIHRQRL